MSKELTNTPKKVSPVDTAMLALMASFTAREARLENLLPSDVPVERFKESIRLALAKNQDLLKCEPGSVLLAVMKAARCGLDVAGVYGHLVPYGAECQFVPDYKGIVALAVATGVVLDMNAVLVYEKDEFIPEEGEAPHIHHRPFVPRRAAESRGEIIAAYTRVLLPGGLRVIKGLIYSDDIARVEAGVKAGKSPWKGPHRPELIKKTSIKNASKTLGLPMSEQAGRLRDAMAADTDEAVDGSFTVEAPAFDPPAKGVAGAKARLQSRNAIPETLETPKESVGAMVDGEHWTPGPEEKAAILAGESNAG